MNEHVQPMTDEALNALGVEEQIILRSKTNYRSLPMMEVLFDQFKDSLALSLSEYTSTKAEVNLKHFEYVSYATALEDFSFPSLFGVVRADQWEGALAIVAEPNLIFTVIQRLLGGRISPGTLKDRNFTGLEKRLGKKFYEVITTELALKLSEVTPVNFAVSAEEEDPEELELAPEDGACVKVVLEILMEGQGGHIAFILPYIAFEPANAVFSKPYRGGEIGGKESWRKAMSNSLQTTDVNLTAVLKEAKVPVHELLAWKPGQVLNVGIDADHEVVVIVSDKHMFRAAMGCRKNGSVALKITKTLTEMDG